MNDAVVKSPVTVSLRA